MNRFVRASKFRHVFGNLMKMEESYLDLKVSRSAWDSNKVYGNTKFLACVWDARGGGSFAVVPRDKPGKFPTTIPLFAGHKAAVLDLDFNPFNENLIASVSEDGYAKLWQIPDGGITSTQREEVQNLMGHRRKVGTANFHPTANGVLATSSLDYTIKVWDVEKGTANLTVEGHTNLIQSLDWDYTGSNFATSSKDRKCRTFDPRTGKCTAVINAHTGAKGARVCYLGTKDLLFTCGFSRSSDRQLAIWDPRKPESSVFSLEIDTSSGQLIPFFDNDTGMVYLSGKGDGNVRMYEVTGKDKICYYVGEFKTAEPMIGTGPLPKLSLDIADCEIARLLKATRRGVEQIQFKVPRKFDLFQDDIYSDTFGFESAMIAVEWFGGKSSGSKLVFVAPGFKSKSKSTQEMKFEKKAEEKSKTRVELEKENKRLTDRVSYLEAELKKRDLTIKELKGN